MHAGPSYQQAFLFPPFTALIHRKVVREEGEAERERGRGRGRETREDRLKERKEKTFRLFTLTHTDSTREEKGKLKERIDEHKYAICRGRDEGPPARRYTQQHGCNPDSL